MIPEQHRKKAGWALVCCTLLAGEEGLRTSAYFDVGGIPTACFGETLNVKMGDKFTKAQCEEMLGDRVEKTFGPGVDKCVKHELPPNRKAAYTSFAYNAGINAFCQSTIVKRENAGNVIGACDAILMWNKVRIAGVSVESPGLNNRRKQERALCLS